MKKTCQELVALRRQYPNGKNDLLNVMLKGVDSKTGQALTDDSIYNNMIIFLIVGHETTSSLLSFLFYYFLKTPSTLATAQKEVDDLLGKGPATLGHMGKLPYITACLRETLRLQPTVPGFSLGVKSDAKGPVFIGKNKYKVEKGTALLAILPLIHRDPAVYEDDAEEFRPERMLEDNFQKLPKAAWKPFGNGMRACIGRAFAWQEALLATCMLLQFFEFRAHDFNYDLEIKNTLTIKPYNFFMHAKFRSGIDTMDLEHMIYGRGADKQRKQSMVPPSMAADAAKTSSLRPMKVFYGSNTGVCHAFARAWHRMLRPMAILQTYRYWMTPSTSSRPISLWFLLQQALKASH